MSTDLNVPDSTMSLRNSRAASQGLLIAYAILALIAVPFLLTQQEMATFSMWLPILMAGGPVVAGLWGAVATYLPDPATGKAVLDRAAKVGVMLLMTAGVSIGAWFTTKVVVELGSQNWDSYDLLKSGGLVTYLALGLLPIICYIVLLQMMSSRRIISGAKWLILSVICLAISMLAPWFWTGFKLYADNHVM